jgi:DNA-binding transcriptional regulator LsrR (DeoR family)
MITMPYNLELLFEVAKLDYIEDLKQESIGRRLKISKYKVNRMLNKAKEEGVIQVRIIKPNDDKRLK